MSSLTREERISCIVRTLRPADPGSWDLNIQYVTAEFDGYDHDQRATIEAQAQRIATLEALRVKYGPICLNCGKAEPCMTEAEANQHGGSIPCTFDPAPRELWDRCKQQAQRIRELEGAIIGLETLLKETRTLHDEYAMAAMTGLLANPSSWNEGDPKVITWARNAADEALRQRKGEP